MTEHQNSPTLINDRSFGKRILEAGATSSTSNILSLQTRQALLSLQPYQTMVFPDDPTFEPGPDGVTYLRRVQQAVLVFARGRPNFSLATRKSRNDETGRDELYVVRKPMED